MVNCYSIWIFSPTSSENCKDVAKIEDGKIQTLLDKEISNGGPQMQEILHSSEIQRARYEGIRYIFIKSEDLEFGFRTIYASVTYLDRFLSGGNRNVKEIRILAMACLSLAAKFTEVKSLTLSDFCMEDVVLESKYIQEMELLVLEAHQWKMGVDTPLNFIIFFAKKLCHKSLRPHDDEFSRIVDLIFFAMRDPIIMCNRSSVIAAGATLAILEQELTKDELQLKIDGLASPQSFDTETIFSCYNLFMNLKMPVFDCMDEEKGIREDDFCNCNFSSIAKIFQVFLDRSQAKYFKQV